MATEIAGCTVLTVGTTPQGYVFAERLAANGALILQRAADPGFIVMNDSPAVTLTNSPRIPKGEYGYCQPYKFTPDGLKHKVFYLVGSHEGQTVYAYTG